MAKGNGVKPLPDFADDVAMAKRGRRSAWVSLRNEAAEHLRNVSTLAQGASADRLPELAAELRTIAARFDELATVEPQ